MSILEMLSSSGENPLGRQHPSAGQLRCLPHEEAIIVYCHTTCTFITSISYIVRLLTAISRLSVKLSDHLHLYHVYQYIVRLLTAIPRLSVIFSDHLQLHHVHQLYCQTIYSYIRSISYIVRPFTTISRSSVILSDHLQLYHVDQLYFQAT